jgi:hypothetical protein
MVSYSVIPHITPPFVATLLIGTVMNILNLQRRTAGLCKSMQSGVPSVWGTGSEHSMKQPNEERNSTCNESNPHICDHCGPKVGHHNSDPMWKNLKNKVTKYEHLYTLPMKNFKGNHGQFFDFFTVAFTPSVPPKSGKWKISETYSLDGQLVSLWCVVEAIPLLSKHEGGSCMCRVH